MTERFHSESALMLIQQYVETLTGRALDNARYSLPFPAPDYADEYVTGCTARLALTRSIALSSSPSNGSTCPHLITTRRCGAMRSKCWRRKSGNLRARRACPTRSLWIPCCDPTSPRCRTWGKLAARLHMSERTLNRRLQQEGTSFRQIKGGILGAWARQHLRETGHSVEAIAAELGYQDAANFRRAFRNSEGCSPSEFRRALKTGSV